MSSPAPTESPFVLICDSHAHLDMPEFDADRAETVSRARAAGVGPILCPIDAASDRSAAIVLDLRAGDARIFAAAGLHPHQAGVWTPEIAARIAALCGRDGVLAIGEIGLDFHYDFAPPESQRAAFRAQLALAEKLGLPVLIHSRNAARDVLTAVDAERFSRGGILHCFTEDADFASRMIERGFFISFSGILTFPGAGGLRETALGIPLDHLLVETDSPYLAPVPYRGRVPRNEPAFVVATARFLAGLRGLAYSELAAVVTANFERFSRSARPAAAS